MNWILQAALVVLYGLLLRRIIINKTYRVLPWHTAYLALAAIDTITFFPSANQTWWWYWWVPLRPVIHIALWGTAIEALFRFVHYSILSRRNQVVFMLMGVALAVTDVAALFGLHKLNRGLYQVAAWRTYSVTGLFVFVGSLALYLWLKDIVSLLRWTQHLRLVVIWCGIHAASNIIAWGASRYDIQAWSFNTNFWCVPLALCLWVWLLNNVLYENSQTPKQEEFSRSGD